MNLGLFVTQAQALQEGLHISHTLFYGIAAGALYCTRISTGFDKIYVLSETVLTIACAPIVEDSKH